MQSHAWFLVKKTRNTAKCGNKNFQEFTLVYAEIISTRYIINVDTKLFSYFVIISVRFVTAWMLSLPVVFYKNNRLPDFVRK